MSTKTKTETKTETKAEEPKYIKVRFPGESLWAIDLGDGKAELANSPLEDGYAFRDIVEIDRNGNIIKKLESRYSEAVLYYDFPKSTDEMDAAYKKFHEEHQPYEKHGMAFEGMVRGMLAVSYPKAMTPEEVGAVVKLFPFARKLAFKPEEGKPEVEPIDFK